MTVEVFHTVLEWFQIIGGTAGLVLLAGLSSFLLEGNTGYVKGLYQQSYTPDTQTTLAFANNAIDAGADLGTHVNRDFNDKVRYDGAGMDAGAIEQE